MLTVTRHTRHQSAPRFAFRAAMPTSPPWALAVAALFLSAGAFAQDEDTAIVSEVLTLESITVDARKIDEPIQQVPFGISVIGAESIERQRIVDGPTVSRQTPGLFYFTPGLRTASSPGVRGNGSFAPLSPDDTSVPLFIDGIPLPLRALDLEFFDIEQISVLRGPQNTTFGRNAQAGIISVTTADPTDEPLFQIGAEVGNFDFVRLTGLASGPLSDTLAGRLAVQFDRRDGDIPDILLNQDLRGQDVVNANGKLVWTPADTTDVTLSLRYGRYDETVTEGVLLEDPDYPRAAFDVEPSQETELVGVGLTARHDFDAATLTSVSGFHFYSSDLLIDSTDALPFSAVTGFPLAAFNDPTQDLRDQREDSIQFSQELRLDGELEDGTRWLAGFSFYRAELDYLVAFRGPLFFQGTIDNRFTTTSFAGFGEVTVPILERLRAIAGFRFTHERKGFSGQFTDPTGFSAVSSFSEDDSLNFNLITGRAALSYDILPEFTGFVSVSRGAKSGGFQLLDPNVTVGRPTGSFNSAFTWAYEGGVRGTLFDDRVDLSVTAFFNDTQDEDISVFELFPAFSSRTENVDTQTYGLEMEAAARLVEGLTLSGGLALMGTEITASEIDGIEVGNETPFTPTLSFNLAVEYEHPLPIFGIDGLAFGRVDYEHVGSRTIDPQNTFELDNFNVVNVRIGWDSEPVSVYGFVENVFDEIYQETTLLAGISPQGNAVSFANPGPPRRFGAGVRVRF